MPRAPTETLPHPFPTARDVSAKHYRPKLRARELEAVAIGVQAMRGEGVSVNPCNSSPAAGDPANDVLQNFVPVFILRILLRRFKDLRFDFQSPPAQSRQLPKLLGLPGVSVAITFVPRLRSVLTRRFGYDVRGGHSSLFPSMHALLRGAS